MEEKEIEGEEVEEGEELEEEEVEEEDELEEGVWPPDPCEQV